MVKQHGPKNSKISHKSSSRFHSDANLDIVADPGCLSRIPDPDFDPYLILDLGSRIPDQKTAMRDICEEKKILSYLFFRVINFTKLNYFIFEMLKKKIWANFQRIIELFTEKIVSKLSEIWVWDPGSGKNLFRIPDPGVKKAPDPGSGSATLLKMVSKLYEK